MCARILTLIILFVFSIGYAQENVKPLSLDEAINTALQNNPEVTASRERINAAKGRLWSGISLPSPEVSLEYELVPVGQKLNNFAERTFAVTQSLEFPTSYFLRHSKLTDERIITEHVFSQTELAVIIRVKSAYYIALAKKEELKLAKENLAIADDFYKKAEVRYNTGEAAPIETMTAKVQYTEAVNNLNIRENELKSALADLDFAMGYGKGMEVNYSFTDSLGFTPVNYSIEKLFETAESNPQLRIDELRVSTSSVEKALAWTSILPSFSISYFNQSTDGTDRYYGGALGVQVPLWFMFDQKGKIQEASANKLAAESELKKSQNEIHFRIHKAFSDYRIAYKQVHLYQSDILPQSEEVYRAASKSYEAGEITYLEFLQAKQTVISSRNNYINTLLSYNQAIMSLEEAVGKRLK